MIKNILTFQHNSQTDIATYGCFDIQGMNDFCHINISQPARHASFVQPKQYKDEIVSKIESTP